MKARYPRRRRLIVTFPRARTCILYSYPRNIAMRHNIRERGLKLLRDLHDSGQYERIVMVAHSLGSIVAYDLVSLFWASRPQALTIREGEPAFQKLRALEAAAHALASADDANRADLLNAYREAQREVDELWQSPAKWCSAALLNIAGMSWFSSDRAIAQYAEEIWGIPVPGKLA